MPEALRTRRGLPADAIPAANAKSAVPPISPPRNSCEFPDSLPSTKRLIGSIPPPLPTARAPPTAMASAAAATAAVTSHVRPCPSFSDEIAAIIVIYTPELSGWIFETHTMSIYVRTMGQAAFCAPVVATAPWARRTWVSGRVGGRICLQAPGRRIPQGAAPRRSPPARPPPEDRGGSVCGRRIRTPARAELPAGHPSRAARSACPLPPAMTVPARKHRA